MVIKSFRDEETLKIFQGKYTKKAEKQLPKRVWNKTRRILEALDAAEELRDLKLYDLDKKKGDLQRWYSLKINDQYRVLFTWEDGDACNVFAGDPDYH